ncbi:hypothetical protein CL619_05025 [archaeon]|nr:hypothetical protein [archaeon]|tara:strand:- start:3468 stop:3920 length:453 start_codon:yes stop_codon:yes gene_type:complete
MVIGSETEILKQISIALLMGFGFGVVQELRGARGAMRMYSLLTAGVALFTILSFALVEAFGENYNYLVWNADPTNILLGLFLGSAIVGAGYIFRNEELGLEGVTLFSSMVIMSSVAVSIGLEKYFLALIMTLMAIAATEVALFIEDRVLH